MISGRSLSHTPGAPIEGREIAQFSNLEPEGVIMPRMSSKATVPMFWLVVPSITDHSPMLTC